MTRYFLFIFLTISPIKLLKSTSACKIIFLPIICQTAEATDLFFFGLKSTIREVVLMM